MTQQMQRQAAAAGHTQHTANLIAYLAIAEARGATDDATRELDRTIRARLNLIEPTRAPRRTISLDREANRIADAIDAARTPYVAQVEENATRGVSDVYERGVCYGMDIAAGIARAEVTR